MLFENRITAAIALIPRLEIFRNEQVVVLAIPRGGVPVGYEIARHFGWTLELVLTKKIGHPMNREYAIGAVNLDGVLLDPAHSDVPASYIESETSRIRQQLRERVKKFAGTRKPTDPKGKTLILVDDGIATGFTMLASIALLRKLHPAKVVVAVPVAPPSIVRKLEKTADDVIILDTPDDFQGVGQFYSDFTEVTDDDVVRYMQAATV
jgi:predicted phosphoribosyltransferase